jgi:ribonuclease P protein component
MLESKFRLRKSEDFQEVIQKGFSVANRQFVIYTLTKKEEEPLRIGISVSKKIGNAVTRNRVKRLIREVIRQNLEQITWRGDFVVIARTPTAEMDFAEVSVSLVRCLKKAKLI